MKNLLAISGFAALIFALASGCTVAESQSQANNDRPTANSLAQEKNKQRWATEKQLVSSALDKIEARLKEKDPKWKTIKREVLVPPEFSSERCNAKLTGKGRSTVRLEIDLMDSAAQSAEFYHLGLQMLARGKATELPGLGDEAVSVTDWYDPSGQVRLLHGRFLIYSFADRPAQAIEVARWVNEEIASIVPKLPRVD